jgi:hypothetical protein
MSDRAEDLRREAARCLTLARTSADPRTHDELIRMAARFHELANSADVDDFGTILGAFNLSTEPTIPPHPEPVVQQQQQQIQAKTKKD